MSTSTITGYLSIACWIIVFTPQLYQNYKNKSGESLSLLFLWIWLIGDIFNIVGIAMQQLIPTMLILAVYYTVADILLIAQIYYYRNRSKNAPCLYETIDNEDEPLLETAADRMNRILSLHSVPVQIQYALPIAIIIVSSLAFILISAFLVGVLGWPQYFGWLGGILYVGSRIPQIVKNHKEENTEGLSKSMFIFSIAGNALYISSIFLYSTERNYILVNMPWIVSAILTFLLDIVIAIQQQVCLNRSNAAPLLF